MAKHWAGRCCGSSPTPPVGRSLKLNFCRSTSGCAGAPRTGQRRPSWDCSRSAASAALPRLERRPGMERLTPGGEQAGRGPSAAPVVAAAVILDPDRPIAGLQDSKQLTAARRESLAVEIRQRTLCWAVGWSEVEEIDALNILEATNLAMRRA